MNTRNTVKGELDELMDDDDWAIIFDSYGNTKGIFIPDGTSDDADVPETIVEILTEAGIDLEEESPVLH